jgi:DNA-binding CsgD family transcriptional regulator
MLDLQFTIEEISDHRVERYFNDLGITNYLISIFFPITIRRYHDYSLNQHASAQLQSAFKVLKSQIVTQALTSTDKNLSFDLDAIQLSVCPIHFPKGGIFLLITPPECSDDIVSTLRHGQFYQHISGLFTRINHQRPVVRLSNREREYVQWIVEGKTTCEIADILSISHSAACFHINNLLRKTQSVTRNQAVAKILLTSL